MFHPQKTEHCNTKFTRKSIFPNRCQHQQEDHQKLRYFIFLEAEGAADPKILKLKRCVMFTLPRGITIRKCGEPPVLQYFTLFPLPLVNPQSETKKSPLCTKPGKSWRQCASDKGAATRLLVQVKLTTTSGFTAASIT